MTREPEWDPDERAWMLGLAAREAAECQRCGGDLAETTSPDSRYVPDLPVVCKRCVALAASEKKCSEHAERAGLIHRVKKVPRTNKKRG